MVIQIGFLAGGADAGEPAGRDTAVEMIQDVLSGISRRDVPEAAGAALLDLWSESAAAREYRPVPFSENTRVWTELLKFCVDRQTLPASSGGGRCRRILFRHAWDRDNLAVLGTADRKEWVRDMIRLIQSDTPVVEPFFLNTLWSLPSKDRLEAVKALGSRMGSDAARLLVALTLYTLVPQKTLDEARDHLAVHGIRRRDIVRDLTAEVIHLKRSHPEERLILKDAIRLALRSSDVRERNAALGRTLELLGVGQFPSDLIPVVKDSIDDAFKKRNFQFFEMGFAVWTALYDHRLMSFDSFRGYSNFALQYNPFDTAGAGRIIDLKGARNEWLDYMGRLVKSETLPKKDRMDILRRVLTIPPDPRHEEALREIVESAVGYGFFDRLEHSRWLEKRITKD